LDATRFQILQISVIYSTKIVYSNQLQSPETAGPADLLCPAKSMHDDAAHAVCHTPLQQQKAELGLKVVLKWEFTKINN